ncbi:MAG: Por secretion system C-terminal sorting protein [Bacteroidetes bacterium]|nr:Por secretion system C-terminal sorting protein [Bacteroidota bacterium]
MQKSLLKISTLFVFIFLSQLKLSVAQTVDLPVGFSPEELQEMQRPGFAEPAYEAKSSFTTPPAGPLRTMGQWEEIQALTITWTSYQSVLREIVRAARLETQVYIICGTACSGSTDSTSVKSYLTAGSVPLTNVHYIYAPCNSVWMRDYGQNSVYMNDVDSLILVDWKYNRPTRTKDDTVPRSIARRLNIPIYETIGANQLINTGGNWICDGLGTSFHSKLIVNENPTLTVPQIDTILSDFMGITRSIKMDTLPYDGIHHLDMHMKLLNEETLLVGQYPAGVADGPQIEANLAYVLANYNSAFGTPYKVIRIPQPPDQLNGYTYPDNGGNYLTYTNATIINKTVIIPQYYMQYDTTALRIWRDAMPGYNVVGINSNITIAASGSLHCITHSVGVTDPLLIVHQNLPNTTNTTTPYQVDARIQHRTGIQTATLYYTTDTALVSYTAVGMTLTNATLNTWTGFIPAQAAGTHVYYYIKAHANSGKEQVRPMPAPRANFEFDVLGTAGIADLTADHFSMNPAYPNPSHGITCIPVSLGKSTKGSIKLYDMLGNLVSVIYEGEMPSGDKNYFLNSVALNIRAGAYLISLETTEGRCTQKLMVR